MGTSKVRDFALPATSGKTFRLSDELRDTGAKALVLYFYPRDSTPGCTTEGESFRDLHKAFRKAGAEVYGISRDSLKSHETFKAKLDFPFELLSDQDERVCTLFGVM